MTPWQPIENTVPTLFLEATTLITKQLPLKEKIHMDHICIYLRKHPEKAVLHLPFIITTGTKKTKYFIQGIMQSEQIKEESENNYQVMLKYGPEKGRKKFIKAVRLVINNVRELR